MKLCLGFRVLVSTRPRLLRSRVTMWRVGETQVEKCSCFCPRHWRLLERTIGRIGGVWDGMQNCERSCWPRPTPAAGAGCGRPKSNVGDLTCFHSQNGQGRGNGLLPYVYPRPWPIIACGETSSRVPLPGLEWDSRVELGSVINHRLLR